MLKILNVYKKRIDLSCFFFLSSVKYEIFVHFVQSHG